MTCFAGDGPQSGGRSTSGSSSHTTVDHLVCLVSSGGLHAFVCSEFETEKPGETKLQEA